MEGTRRRLPLRANFAWLSVGRVLYAASQWAVLVILAKLTSSEVVGEFALALAISAPVSNFAMLGLRRLLVTDTRRDYRFGHYLGLRAICGVGMLLVVGATAAVVAERAETGAVIVLVGLVSSLRMQSDILQGLFQIDDRLDYTARSLMLRSVLSPVLMGVGVAWSGQLIVGVLGQVLAIVIVIAFHDVPRARSRTRVAPGASTTMPAGTTASLLPIFEAPKLARLAWQALPLGFTGLLSGLTLQMPRYFIASELGLEPLAYFAVMIYIVSAGSRVVAALGSSALARMSRLYWQGEVWRCARLLARLAAVGFALGASGVLVVAVAGRELLTILYSEDYARYTGEFVLIMVAGLLMYVATLLQVGLTAARLFRLQLLHHGLLALTSLASSYLLIGEWGLRGAALATLVTYAVHLAGLLAINFWSLRIRRVEIQPPAPARPAQEAG